MITNSLKLNKFYEKLLRREKLSYKKAWSIFEILRREAIALGAINSKSILEGIEDDIKLAKILNSIGKYHD